MRRLAERIETAIAAVLRPVVFAGMALLVVVITAQIVFRTAFTALGWTEELSRFALVWLTFLGATLALAQSRHIAVTQAVDRLPPRARRAVGIAANLAAAAFLGALAVVSWRYMQMQSFQTSAAMRLPMDRVYAVIPASAAVMTGLCLLRAAAGPAAPAAPQPTTSSVPAPQTDTAP